MNGQTINYASLHIVCNVHAISSQWDIFPCIFSRVICYWICFVFSRVIHSILRKISGIICLLNVNVFVFSVVGFLYFLRCAEVWCSFPTIMSYSFFSFFEQISADSISFGMLRRIEDLISDHLFAGEAGNTIIACPGEYQLMNSANCVKTIMMRFFNNSRACPGEYQLNQFTNKFSCAFWYQGIQFGTQEFNFLQRW